MPAALLDAGALAAAVLAFAAPLRAALATLLTVALLVPSTLIVPHQPSTQVTVVRLVLAGFALGLLRRRLSGGLTAEHTRGTPVHAAWLLLLGVATCVGVALALPTTSDVTASRALVSLADYGLTFAAVLVAVRASDEGAFVLRLLGGLAVAAAVVAVVEHATGASLSRTLYYARLPDQGGDGAARLLATRSGQPRVRAMSQFAVEYAWVAAALLPLVVAAASWSRRWLPWAVGGALVVLSVYWSYTRSAAAPLAAAVVAVGLLSRRRRLLRVSAVAALAVAVVLLADPGGILHHFSSSVDQGSISSRYDRWTYLLREVAARPLLGVGLTGTEGLGLSSTDNSYLLLYAQGGVLLLATWGALLLTALGCAARGLRAADPDDRVLAAAAFCGMAVLVAGGFAYDQVTTPQSMHVMWVLAALGVAAAERQGALAPWPQTVRPLRVAAATAAAAVAGIAVYALAPVHTAEVLRLDTLPVRHEVSVYADTHYLGNLYVNSVCGALDVTVRTLPDADVECRNLNEAGGSAMIRVSGGTRADFDRAVALVTRTVADAGRLGAPRLQVLDPPDRARDTVTATAPVWLTVLGAAAGLCLPAAPRRRLRHARPLIPVAA